MRMRIEGHSYKAIAHRFNALQILTPVIQILTPDVSRIPRSRLLQRGRWLGGEDQPALEDRS